MTSNGGTFDEWLERVVDNFASGSGGQCGENRVRFVGQEANRSSGKEKVGPSGMQASEVKHVAVVSSLTALKPKRSRAAMRIARMNVEFSCSNM